MEDAIIIKYQAIIHEQMDNILNLYEKFADNKPIMLYDIQEKRIYAYPYQEFLDDINEKARNTSSEQYHNAVSKNQLVVFVRDNEARQLLSFTYNL